MKHECFVYVYLKGKELRYKVWTEAVLEGKGIKRYETAVRYFHNSDCKPHVCVQHDMTSTAFDSIKHLLDECLF